MYLEDIDDDYNQGVVKRPILSSDEIQVWLYANWWSAWGWLLGGYR